MFECSACVEMWYSYELVVKKAEDRIYCTVDATDLGYPIGNGHLVSIRPFAEQ